MRLWGAGLASDAPAYYEGLLNTIQGKDTEAEVCYDRGKANPLYRERDLYYLKSMSVEELYALREQAAVLETAVWQEYALYDVRKETTPEKTFSGDNSESDTVDTDFIPYMRMTLTVDMPG